MPPTVSAIHSMFAHKSRQVRLLKIGLSLPSSNSSFLGLKIQKSYQERLHNEATTMRGLNQSNADHVRAVLVISELDPSV